MLVHRPSDPPVSHLSTSNDNYGYEQGLLPLKKITLKDSIKKNPKLGKFIETNRLFFFLTKMKKKREKLIFNQKRM